MSFFENLRYFFVALFSPDSPEVKKRQHVKSIESRLSKKTPKIYKNGMILESVPQALFIIYSEISYFNNLLDFISLHEQIHIKRQVYDTLLETGCNETLRKKLDNLHYEKRKEAFTGVRVYDFEMRAQNQTFFELQKELKGPVFTNIEEVIQNLELFYDLSSFNFTSMLKSFSTSFSENDTNPLFTPRHCDALTEDLLNFYYVIAKMKVTASLARAICAIASFFPEKSKNLSQDAIMLKLKKIASALNNIVSPQSIKDLIIIGKKGDKTELECASNQTTIIDDYLQRFKNTFEADSRRLTMEYQNERRMTEINNVLGKENLVDVKGYNTEANDNLQKNTPCSFTMIQPIQLLKSFMTEFFPPNIEALLNDIVLDGVFASPLLKTQFSSCAFECLEIKNKITAFENAFSRNEKFDSFLIEHYRIDSVENSDILIHLERIVEEINMEASALVNKATNQLNALYILLTALFEDFKLSTPEYLPNVKQLFTSTRNKESVDVYSRISPKWKNFLQLMRNYTEFKKVELAKE